MNFFESLYDPSNLVELVAATEYQLWDDVPEMAIVELTGGCWVYGRHICIVIDHCFGGIALIIYNQQGFWMRGYLPTYPPNLT